MKVKQTLFLFLTVLLTVAAIKAQDEPIRVETNLVTINVSVTDKNGKNVSGLTQDQFEIFDNKIKQKIEYFSAEKSPVIYGIVYDMHPTTAERMTATLEGLRAFTKNLSPDDRFFITAFNHQGSLNLDFIPTVEQIEQNLTFQTKTREPNSLYDAIVAAADKIKKSQNLKKTILVISDSADHNSRHSFSELNKQLKMFDVQVYAVIFDEDNSLNWSYSNVSPDIRLPRKNSGDASPLDRVAIQELTLKTGGMTHYPTTQTGQELFRIFEKISAEVRRQYAISFYPSETDGQWHDLVINIRKAKDRKNFALTYRQGYQSSK